MHDIRKYVVGNVAFRIKMVETNFGFDMSESALRKWKYYMGGIWRI